MIIALSLDQACCKALTAECLSCTKGQSIEEFCRDDANKDVVGCQSNHVKWIHYNY